MPVPISLLGKLHISNLKMQTQMFQSSLLEGTYSPSGVKT